MVPVRISFTGGGTDMPEYFEKYGGSVISSSINQFTYVLIKPRLDNLFQAFSTDLEIHQSKISYEKLKSIAGTEIVVSVLKYLKYDHGADFLICSDVPAGSGLGASSSLTVNIVNTIQFLMKKKISKQKIAETAFHIERNLLKHPIGKQDDYISSFGGFNRIDFNKNSVKVTPINIKKRTLLELEQNLLLFFVGTTRNSSTILSNQLSRTSKMNNQTISSLHTAKELSDEMYSSLKKSDITNFGELLHKGWITKQKFAKGVSNSKLDSIYKSAMSSGALGGKLTGAGGGGHFLFYCEKPKQKSLIKKMEHLGLNHVKFNFHKEGPKVLNLYDFSN